MNFSPLDLLIGALAVWRLSAMIAYERGPFKLFYRIRSAVGILHYDDGSPDTDLATSELQQMLLCVWCSSPWLAGLWLVGYLLIPEITLVASGILALSAVAITLERVNHA